ncbi:MAG: flp pilus-assembly TadE/G-like family protein [Propionibacteriales bacterium]|nr:flp pilus-assembly TadE/G-like family protein [Propionibacteriales bacterium]
MRPARRGEGGVAVVLSLILIAVLMSFAVIAGGAVALVVDHRKAQAAADLAALAGAGGLQSGLDGCTAAGRIAEANGSVLQECVVRGPEVVVTVVVRASALLGGRSLRARARAGPSADVAQHPGDLDP